MAPGFTLQVQWRLLALSRGLGLPMPRPFRAPYFPGLTVCDLIIWFTLICAIFWVVIKVTYSHVRWLGGEESFDVDISSIAPSPQRKRLALNCLMRLFHLRHSTLRRIDPHVEKGALPGAWRNCSSDGLVWASVHHKNSSITSRCICDSKLGKINENPGMWQIHSPASQSSGLLPSTRRNSWLSQTGCRQGKLGSCWSWFEFVPSWQVKWGDSGWPVQGSQWEEHFSCNALPCSPNYLNTSGHMWIPTFCILLVHCEVNCGIVWQWAMARYTDQQWSTISAWASMRMQTLWRTASSLQMICCHYLP